MKPDLHLASSTPPVANDQPELVMPPHFARSKRLKDAWADLIESTDKTLHVKQNRFTFEITATLLSKFRSGKPMSATESKELKKQMVALGLAQDDEASGGGKKKNALTKYIR